MFSSFFITCLLNDLIARKKWYKKESEIDSVKYMCLKTIMYVYVPNYDRPKIVRIVFRVVRIMLKRLQYSIHLSAAVSRLPYNAG